MSPEVTCILTSCGRPDLLKITVDSFLKFNTYKYSNFFIYEDSGIENEMKFTAPCQCFNWIEPKERTGQIVALDTLWSHVKTPYAFCMEDDWEFYREGFIEDSMKILEAQPTILQVWLRELEDTNKHPVYWKGGYGILKSDHGLWAGTRFNPSLKRKADYDLIGSYGKYTTFNRKAPWKSEAAISQVYHKLGFKAAILPEGYIRHIGGNGRHVT